MVSSTWAWMSGPILAVAHAASTNGPACSGRSACFSTASNTAAWAARPAARRAACDLGRPAGRLGLHLPQRREVPAAPEGVAGHTASAVPPAPCPSASGRGPGRPDSRSARRARHRTGSAPGRRGPGLSTPVFRLSGHQPGRDAAEERERLDVALGPGPLVHRQDRADEQVPRAGQHHDQCPDGAEPPGRRVGPPAEHPVVDLGLLPGRGRTAGSRPSPAPGAPLRDVSADIAADDATLVASPRQRRSRQRRRRGDPAVQQTRGAQPSRCSADPGRLVRNANSGDQVSQRSGSSLIASCAPRSDKGRSS